MGNQQGKGNLPSHVYSPHISSPSWPSSKLRAAVTQNLLAPFYPPKDGNYDECQICFMCYEGGLNRCTQCNHYICSECYCRIVPFDEYKKYTKLGFVPNASQILEKVKTSISNPPQPGNTNIFGQPSTASKHCCPFCKSFPFRVKYLGKKTDEEKEHEKEEEIQMEIRLRESRERQEKEHEEARLRVQIERAQHTESQPSTLSEQQQQPQQQLQQNISVRDTSRDSSRRHRSRSRHHRHQSGSSGSSGGERRRRSRRHSPIPSNIGDYIPRDVRHNLSEQNVDHLEDWMLQQAIRMSLIEDSQATLVVEDEINSGNEEQQESNDSRRSRIHIESGNNINIYNNTYIINSQMSRHDQTSERRTNSEEEESNPCNHESIQTNTSNNDQSPVRTREKSSEECHEDSFDDELQLAIALSLSMQSTTNDSTQQASTEITNSNQDSSQVESTNSIQTSSQVETTNSIQDSSQVKSTTSIQPSPQVQTTDSIQDSNDPQQTPDSEISPESFTPSNDITPQIEVTPATEQDIAQVLDIRAVSIDDSIDVVVDEEELSKFNGKSSTSSNDMESYSKDDVLAAEDLLLDFDENL